MNLRETRSRAARDWLTSLSPTWLLVGGWALFVVFSYPGYLSYNSIEQFGEMRTGVYSDRFSPVMTLLWSVIETVLAGPQAMLLLQSGLFLFGLATILRRVLTPRAAAITATCVLLFPPVFSPMAVIWPEPMMAGALLAAVACGLERAWKWRAAGACALLLAISCRPEVLVAAAVLATLAFAQKRLALGAVVAAALLTAGVHWVLVDRDTGAWETNLMVPDTLGTLKRAHVDGPTIEKALDGLIVVQGPDLADRVHELAFDPFPMMAGKTRVLELPTVDELPALRRDWRHAIASYPGAYLKTRYNFSKRLLGKNDEPIFDDFGDKNHLAVLHHRASKSDLEVGYQAVAHALEFLYRPWLWILLGIAAFVVVRERTIRTVIASGWAIALTMCVLAPVPEYRFVHWVVVSSAIGIAAVIAKRRWPA